MVEQAARLGPATLARYGEILHAGLIEMRGATAPRLLLELLCARMLLPAASTAEPALLERLERMERRADRSRAGAARGERGGPSVRAGRDAVGRGPAEVRALQPVRALGRGGDERCGSDRTAGIPKNEQKR